MTANELPKEFDGIKMNLDEFEGFLEKFNYPECQK